MSVLGSAIDAYAAVDVDVLPGAVLAGQIADLDRAAARIAAEQARRIVAFEAADGPAADGALSTVSWLRGAVRCGHREAAVTVRTARQLRDLPRLAAAVAAGEVSWGHVTAVAPVLTECRERRGPADAAVAEEVLATLARTESVDTCRTAARAVRLRIDPDGSLDAANRDFRRRSVSVATDADGCVHLRGLLDPEGGATVLAALDAVTPPPVAGDERTAPQRRADGLVDLCALAVGHDLLPTVAGHRPHATLTVDLPTLEAVSARSGVPIPAPVLDRLGTEVGAAEVGPVRVDPAGAGPAGVGPAGVGPAGVGPAGVDAVVAGIRGLFCGGARLDWTGPVPPQTARRLTCDATLTRLVLDPDGQPVDLGRTRRLVSPAQRIALAARDRGCIADGCGREPQWCDAHHLVHWADGGSTDLAGLVLLCRPHHRKTHEEHWVVVEDHLGRHRLVPPHKAHPVHRDGHGHRGHPRRSHGPP